MKALVSSRLPTKFGQFTLKAFPSGSENQPHLIFCYGEKQRFDIPLVRIHSECLTGDIFGSLRCDCGSQLEKSMQLISESGFGYLLYLRQEGRGIGLLNKLRAYNLQDHGFDTVESNEHLGFEADERDFSIAAQMLKEMNVDSINLLTNNPDKITGVEQEGIVVKERIPLQVKPNDENLKYLRTKREKQGHLLSV